jgi:hypothetical protein
MPAEVEGCDSSRRVVIDSWAFNLSSSTWLASLALVHLRACRLSCVMGGILTANQLRMSASAVKICAPTAV